MRASKREQILAAAKQVVQRAGVTALTYESVAAEAGLTKGGLVYHFASRQELLLALHEYVAGQWEEQLRAEAGGTPEQVDAAARIAAYVRASQNPDRAELLLMLEAADNPQANAVWDAVYERWAPAPQLVPEHDDGAEAAALDAFIARLAADGLWFHEALAAHPLDAGLRARLVERITALGSFE